MTKLHKDRTNDLTH